MAYILDKRNFLTVVAPFNGHDSKDIISWLSTVNELVQCSNIPFVFLTGDKLFNDRDIDIIAEILKDAPYNSIILESNISVDNRENALKLIRDYGDKIAQIRFTNIGKDDNCIDGDSIKQLSFVLPVMVIYSGSCLERNFKETVEYWDISGNNGDNDLTICFSEKGVDFNKLALPTPLDDENIGLFNSQSIETSFMNCSIYLKKEGRGPTYTWTRSLAFSTVRFAPQNDLLISNIYVRPNGKISFEANSESGKEALIEDFYHWQNPQLMEVLNFK